ncbi:MAG: hypothetical protein P4L57_07760 [Rhizomicrobium sp.]|nr:hypothetical protein [Rhizomicrobium sp.]
MICVFALAVAASAQTRRGGSSLDRVLPHIRQTVPGTFYDAEGPFLSPNGQATYRIKWMTPDGRIIWFAVDASSGQIMGGAPGARYRPEEDRGWAPSRDNDSPSRYGDRGWDRQDHQDRYGPDRRGDGRDSGAGAGGRYDRGERTPDRSQSDRGSDRGGGDRGQSGRGHDSGRDRPHSR